MTTEKPNLSPEQGEEKLDLKRESGKVQELKNRLNRIFPKNLQEVYGKTAVFGNSLRERYKDCQDYRLFHVIASSGVPTPDYIYPKFDFPGDDSVEKFIESLEAEYGEKNP